MGVEHLSVELELAEALDAQPQIRRATGRESISGLFQFDLNVVVPGARTPENARDLGRLVGSAGSLVWRRDGVEERRLHGMFCEGSAVLHDDASHRAFRLRFVPRAWKLGLVQKIEVFMDRSIPEIVKHVFDLHDLSAADLDLRLTGDYPKREFVVQYAETDLAFISRLTEHLGIAFYVRHDDDRDRVVFVDGADAYEKPERSTVAWRDNRQPRAIHQIESTQRMIPSVYAVHDYNYRTPMVDLSQTVESSAGASGGVVEFGPHVKTLEEARRLAQTRAEEREATALVYDGTSDDAALGAGRVIHVDGHPTLEHRDLLVTEVEHRVEQSALLDGDGAASSTYENRFHAVPAAAVFRPPRRTPVPKVHGLLTGIVEGPEGTSGDFASIDGEGRYTVRFLFDTTTPGQRAASRPVRMAQNHAGAGYGTHFPLKPGTEVVLAFVNGDPDRPIIVGAVPNPVTATPVRDANLTSNMIKTASGIFFDFNDGPRGR